MSAKLPKPSPEPSVSHRPGRGGRISDRVADSLLARIASGEWTPGQRLPGERQLAEDMGVSRVSVRAALQSLKTQGFVDAVQGAAPGWFPPRNAWIPA
ncbi:MAG: winged helix-turn-helix domain-containing protein [Magnetospirillum sp.]|nr:winged helix-turn-helix domain-containing protein [Magnetospirillum sp.]